jgi:hypothetical protein
MDFPITINSSVQLFKVLDKLTDEELFKVLDKLTNEEGMDLRTQAPNPELNILWGNGPHEKALREVEEALGRSTHPRTQPLCEASVPETVLPRLKRYELRAKCWGKALGVLRGCRSVVGAPRWDKTVKMLPEKYRGHWVFRALRINIVRGL